MYFIGILSVIKKRVKRNVNFALYFLRCAVRSVKERLALAVGIRIIDTGLKKHCLNEVINLGFLAGVILDNDGLGLFKLNEFAQAHFADVLTLGMNRAVKAKIINAPAVTDVFVLCLNTKSE